MIAILRKNWFYFVLPFLLLAAWLLSQSPAALRDPILLERVLVFDSLISLPVLYFLFLRKRMPGRATALRVAALAGSGVWLASLAMPAGSGQILPWLAWMRYVALPILIGVELIAVIAVIRHVYGSEPDKRFLIAQGMPPILAKAMLAEARFWKRVARWVRGDN